MIELKNISKNYSWGDNNVSQVLNKACLKINQYEFVALLGRSGSGKSTIMNIIGLLDNKYDGSLLIDGKNPKNMDSNKLAKFRNQNIGFIFQQFILLPQLTISENVALPLTYSSKNIKEPSKLVEKALKSVGIIDLINKKPNQLSGGQQQRVAIARSLICEPRLILADEPTGSLDIESGKSIIELFKKINNDLGTTIIMVTHDNIWANSTQRVLKVYEGKILG